MRKALDELLDLFNYLRVWKIETNVYIDALMSPTEDYHRDIFFQVSHLSSLPRMGSVTVYYFSFLQKLINVWLYVYIHLWCVCIYRYILVSSVAAVETIIKTT